MTRRSINGTALTYAYGGSRVEDYLYSGFLFSTSPFLIRAYRLINDSNKTEASYPPPATAKVGESGRLTIMPRVFVDGLTATQIVTEWSLNADSSTTAWLCVDDRLLTTVGVTSSLSDVVSRGCAKIDTVGYVMGYKLDFIEQGEMLHFR